MTKNPIDLLFLKVLNQVFVDTSNKMAETANGTGQPKPVHTLVLDAGPILKNTPPLSTLLARSEELITTPAVVREIRDPDARARVETLYLPFLKQRSPNPKSVAVLSEFARKTGDRTVLSKTDIEVLALAYEIECERNGGDWRLRSVPGQKSVNGKPPVKEEEEVEENEEKTAQEAEDKPQSDSVDAVTEDLQNTTLENGQPEKEDSAAEADASVEQSNADAESAQNADGEGDEGSESDGGWITPSNLKKRQIRDESASMSSTPEPKIMQVATITTDFAVCSHAS